MFLIFKVFGPLYTFVTIPYYAGPFKGGCSVNTDYMYVPIFPDFVGNFLDFSPISLQYFPILCTLDNLTL